MFSEDTYWYIVRKIGEMFKKYRQKSGLTLRDIYNDKQISSMAVVSELENGKKLPRFDTFLQLMSSVDMPYNKVFVNDVLPKKERKNQDKDIISKSADDELRDVLLARGYDHKEIDDVFKYLQFIQSQREPSKK